MQALVLTFDRLAIRFLGCYGNDWVETPNFDLVASQSVLFENHYIENVNTASANHAWWSGRCSFDDADNVRETRRSPFEILKENGVSLHAIVEDDANSPAFPLRNFENIVEIESDRDLFDRAVSELEKLEPQDSWLLWMKSKGIAFPSFSTDESLQLFLEDDEIEVAQEIATRYANWLDEKSTNEKDQRVSFNDLFSVDEERMLHAVYAACVYELDRELGMLWERVGQLRQDELLIVIAGARGEWLGEPLPASHPDCSVCESVIHTPLLIRFHDVRQSVRLQEFVQTVDLLPTIFGWFGVSAPAEFEGASLLALTNGNAETRPHYFCSDRGNCLSVGSKEFFLRTHANSVEEIDLESCRLYHRPEDAWHVNDVGNQWPQRREELWQILSKFKKG